MKSIRKNSQKRRNSRKNNKKYNKRKTVGRKYNNNNKNRLTKRKGGMPPPLPSTRTVGDYDPVKELQRTKDEYSKFLVKKRAEDDKKGIFNIVKVQKPKELCQWANTPAGCTADTWRNKEKKEEHFAKYTHSPEEAEISQLLYNLITYKVNRNERNLNAYDAEIKHFIELCYDLYIKNRPDFPRWMYSDISEYFQFHSEYAFDDYKDTHRLHFYLLASILKNIDYYAAAYPNMSFWGLFLHSLFEENAVTGIYPVPGKEPLSNTSLYFYIEKAIPKV
jgi:hypothetical protein